MEDSGTCLWQATDDDPQVELSGLERCAGRWVRFRARLELKEGAGRGSTWPKLRFDCPGYSDLHPLVLPECSAERPHIDYVFRVPRTLRAARLTPVDRRTRFWLRDARVAVLSRYGAAFKMLVQIATLKGVGSAVQCAVSALMASLHNRRRVAKRYPLIERYRDLYVRRGSSYLEWIRCFEPPVETYAGLAKTYRSWTTQPKIAIFVAGTGTGGELLQRTTTSLSNQLYANWELCAAGKHIGGAYIAVVKPGDELHPLALYFVAEAIAANPDAGLFYTDEDKIDSDGKRYEPYFKCAFNYELLLTHNMVGNLAVFRRDLVESARSVLDDGGEGNEYSLVLHAVEKVAPGRVVHIPRVLYHSRSTPRFDPRQTVHAHLVRRGVVAEVMAAEPPNTSRVRFDLPRPFPKVSVIVPTRDQSHLLRTCLTSIAQKTTYQNLEVIVIDNGSREDATLRLLEDHEAQGVRILRDDAPFNFSTLNNRAVQQASGDYVCLMNNDIEVLSPDWIEEMLSFAAHPAVGAVGARLWYPDGLLQHGGVILGLGSVADHAHRFLRRGESGYFGRAGLHQSLSAVTAACLLIRKSLYQQLHGLDENLTVAFNDIDFCLRVSRAGYRNVWTPYAEMIHHESASRGSDRAMEKQPRVVQELEFMERRWGTLLLKDPAYSPNLSLEQDFALAWPPRNRDARRPW
jgi:O-antigen biosynthesis protein